MLTARAQLDFTRTLIQRFSRSSNDMQQVTDYQSIYIAIVTMLRSVGHTFAKADCEGDPTREAWCKLRWKVWKQEPIFANFIEPNRNDLLKEFAGNLQLNSEAFGMPAFVAFPTTESVGYHVGCFEPTKVCDHHGRLVLPLFKDAVAFWDRCLREAEADSCFC